MIRFRNRAFGRPRSPQEIRENEKDNILNDKKLKELHSQVIVIMLTTSDNPDDIARLKKYSFVSDYIIKPLINEKMQNIINKYFN